MFSSRTLRTERALKSFDFTTNKQLSIQRFPIPAELWKRYTDFRLKDLKLDSAKNPLETPSYYEPEGKNESARLQGIFPILAVLGKFDEAFECLMRMADLGAWWIGIKYFPHYAPLRKDPRYREFCKKVGIKP